MKRLFQFALLLLLTVPAWGYNTWYISTTGSDSNAGTSSGLAWATFTHAWAGMAGGDTLIVNCGTYTQQVSPPSTINGSSGAYTTIQAATDWCVTIDESSGLAPWNGALTIGSGSYFQVRGMKFETSPTYSAGQRPIIVVGSDHVKLIKTAGFGAPCAASPSDDYNVNTYQIGPGNSYVLIEDSHAWGCGRYQFNFYQSDHVILRHSVARIDFAGCGNECGVPDVSIQMGLFTMYDSYQVLFQNDIGLDTGTSTNATGNLYGGIQSENNDAILASCSGFVSTTAWCSGNNPTGPGCEVDPHGVSHGTTGQDNSGSYEGLIFINLQGLYSPPAIFDDKLNGTRIASNIAMANTAGGFYGDRQATGVSEASDLLVNHVTAYNITGPGGNSTPSGGVGADENCNTNFTRHLTQNSAIENMQSFGLSTYMTSNYNIYFNNPANFGTFVYLGNVPTAGADDLLGTNPQLKYITRVEPGTPGYGTASDGGNIGATILYRQGTPGTLWGDTGYDTLTSTALWPWDDEAVIKSDMASFSMTNPVYGGTISGARGFAAAGNGLYGGPITLTSYVWEQVGYACPGTICTGATPTASFSGGVKFGAGKFQ